MNWFYILTLIGLLNTAHAQSIIFSPETAREIIYSYAVVAGINGGEFYNTIKCESNLDPSAIGDHGESVGLAQIHLTAHTDITKAEALDPLWSLNWASHEFAIGNAHIWTCHTRLYGSNSP